MEGNRRLLLIEAKATRTPMPGDARNLARLAAALGPGAAARAVVVHDDTKEYAAPMALCPGVRAVGWRALHCWLDERPPSPAPEP